MLELEARGRRGSPDAAPTGCQGLVPFLSDLCHVQAARAAGEVGRICAELVFGYQRHPAWDEAGCAGCYGDEDLGDLEQLIPGIQSTAGAYTDVIGRDGVARGEGRAVRAVPGAGRLPALAGEARRLPDRLAPGEGPRGARR